jgi:hypothetical protein
LTPHFESVEIAAEVSTHFLDDEILVFCSPTQSLYKLNATAAYIWCLLESGLTPNDIHAKIVEAFQIDPDRASGDIGELITEWLSAGLVVRPGADESPVRLLEPQPEASPEAGPIESLSDEEFGRQFRFTLAEKTIRVRLPSTLEEEAVRPIFSHLETDNSPFGALLDVISRDGEYIIFSDEAAFGRATLPVELGPLLSQEALRIAYRSHDHLIAVHAGAVGNGEGAIVTPGPSGAGKSTLTAALIAAGFVYYTDEVAIIERGTHLLAPCPVSLRIKLGSWDVVRSLWKRPPSVCHTVAPDGQVINYVVPPEGSYAKTGTQACPVKAMVFPRYDAAQGTQLSPMSKTEAVTGLQNAGYDVRGDLTSAKVTELVAWIKDIPCYSLSFRSLEEAVELVRGVFS